MNTKTIVYFKHGLGNLIMMTPALQALAASDPSKKVDVCLSSHWQDPRRPSFDEFFSLCPFVQDVVNYPEQQFTKKYNLWFYTEHTESSDAYQIFKAKNNIHCQKPDWKSCAVHEVFWYIDMVNLHRDIKSVPGQFVPTAAGPELNSKGVKIGICNGTYSEKMKHAKKWPYFNELVSVLKSYYDCTIIKVGYQDELSDVTGADIDYVGKLTFCETAKVISQLDLFITTDTGLMHAGDALDVPMVVLFGGSLISKNGAISRNAINITQGLDCQPCQRTSYFYNCPHYDCMIKLSVGEVMKHVTGRLKCRN